MLKWCNQQIRRMVLMLVWAVSFWKCVVLKEQNYPAVSADSYIIRFADHKYNLSV